jgi:hypothetical protein
MTQVEVPGGGIIDSGDRRIERKVVVAANTNPTAPGGTGRLTNVSITNEPGGLRRGIFEYTVAGVAGEGFNDYGKRIELLGGTREVPIYNHPKFIALTESQILEVQKAVEEKKAMSFTDATQQKLRDFLQRGVEYVLSPSVTGRVTEIESNLPNLDPVGKVGNPSELSAPNGTFWICTGISASPSGDKFEVTREYTLSFSTWDDTNYLYGWP